MIHMRNKNGSKAKNDDETIDDMDWCLWGEYVTVVQNNWDHSKYISIVEK